MKLYKNIFYNWLNKDKDEKNKKRILVEEYYRKKNYNITILEDRVLMRERSKYNLYCSTKDEEEVKDYKEIYTEIISKYIGKEESTSEYEDVKMMTKGELIKRVIELERKMEIIIREKEENKKE